ncbi:hypothetical protein SAMN04488107_2025 [Geodermatophilus saharensis]|uniref:Peptidase family S51 n=1 Tax=Geodermatophilus saharensis TaxID=1137994 RepID=A0A239D653_9ACTN|nr:hypothetical protein [Geodermatophilus saharensis]SNS27996.1 hypothetical protein SAMN04488107_2025 [Geodermatophilus saharensis]
MSPSITLLGPQRRPTLDRVLSSLGITGPVAVVNAGWQERESDDAEILALAGGQARNLRLFARWMDVLRADPEYAEAEREHRLVLDELQQLYLVRLDHALQAVYAVAGRSVGHPTVQARAMEDALAAVRLLDASHVARVQQLHDDFYGTWRLESRGAIAGHREEVRGLLSAAECLVVAGGHVGELVRIVHLFHLAPHLPPRVVAWSAGAMALTPRVVLFHDRAAQGASLTEVFDAGIGVVPGLVLLPHARRRLRTDDPLRMSVLARRFAPATCVVLDDGVRIDLGPGGALPPDARLVGDDGRITEGTAA